LLQRALKSPSSRHFGGRTDTSNLQALEALERLVSLVDETESRLRSGQTTAATITATLAAAAGAVAETVRLSRQLYTKNPLALSLMQRAAVYATHVHAQHNEVREMLSIADSHGEQAAQDILQQALWTAELALDMVTAAVAMLHAAASEVAVDNKKAEGMRF
jgi:hypothetical protein